MKQIEGFPTYYITENGKVFSKKIRHKDLHEMVPQPNDKGYLGIGLYRDGKRYYRFVHRLILETFVGPCPPEMECCHNDGNPQNNNLTNLRWDTRANNLSDRWKHNTMTIGSKSGKAKLTENDVIEIRRRYDAGETQMSIAKDFNIVASNISHIVNRNAWKHV